MMSRFIGVLLGIVLAVFIGVPSTAPEPLWAECGMCGAHVSEWWYVRGYDGSPVEVCHDCYELVKE